MHAHARTHTHTKSTNFMDKSNVTKPGMPGFKNCNIVTELTLCHEMYSSLNIALSILWILKYGCARQRAVANMHIVSIPVFPSVDMNVCKLGVNLNGTDLLASNSPTIK